MSANIQAATRANYSLRAVALLFISVLIGITTAFIFDPSIPSTTGGQTIILKNEPCYFFFTCQNKEVLTWQATSHLLKIVLISLDVSFFMGFMYTILAP